MKKEHLIVFDIDGTLTQSVSAHQQAFTQALIEIGVSKVPQNFGTFKHHTDFYIAKCIYEEHINQEFTPELLQAFEHHLLRYIKNVSIKEIPGARKVLHQLESATPFGIAYATGSMEAPARYKLQSMEMVPPFSTLVGSNACETREGIVTEAISRAQEHYGVRNFDRIIAVGDGIWDLKTAQQLGLEFIGIGNIHKDSMMKNGMTTHFDTMESFVVN